MVSMNPVPQALETALAAVLESSTAVQRARQKLQQQGPPLGAGGGANRAAADGEPAQDEGEWVHVVPLNDHYPRDRCTSGHPALLYLCDGAAKSHKPLASSQTASLEPRQPMDVALTTDRRQPTSIYASVLDADSCKVIVQCGRTVGAPFRRHRGSRGGASARLVAAGVAGAHGAR